MQLNIKFITIATIKAILKRKDILYGKVKIPSATCIFKMLLQFRAFSYKLTAITFIQRKKKLLPDLRSKHTLPFYSTSMADKSCSSSDFSEGASCDSGVVWPSDADPGSVVVGVPGSWVSGSADTSAGLAFSDN